MDLRLHERARRRRRVPGALPALREGVPPGRLRGEPYPCRPREPEFPSEPRRPGATAPPSGVRGHQAPGTLRLLCCTLSVFSTFALDPAARGGEFSCLCHPSVKTTSTRRRSPDGTTRVPSLTTSTSST